MDLIAVFEDLYKSEINFTLSIFWDAGYTVQIGDDWNGFTDKAEMLDTLDEVASELVRMAINRFPDSYFSEKYNKMAVKQSEP